MKPIKIKLVKIETLDKKFAKLFDKLVFIILLELVVLVVFVALLKIKFTNLSVILLITIVEDVAIIKFAGKKNDDE